MSDTPGPNPHPRDRRRGDRPRKRKPRGEQRNAAGDRWQREGRHRHRQRKRTGKEKPPPAPAKISLRQKLLTILTFGLLKPKRPALPSRRDKESKPAESQDVAPVPAADLEAITGPRLFVGNLHYRAEEQDLLDLFKGIGPVASVDVVYDGRTYQSRGCGFVEFMKAQDARRAVEELHGLPFYGRPLMLGPAEPRGEDARERDLPA